MYALQTKGKIRIGALDNAAPFSSRDPSGRYVGFEPDLGRELAKAIFGTRQDIDSVIEGLQSLQQSDAAAYGSLFEHLRQFVDGQAGGPARKAPGSGMSDGAVAAKPAER